MAAVELLAALVLGACAASPAPAGIEAEFVEQWRAPQGDALKSVDGVLSFAPPGSARWEWRSGAGRPSRVAVSDAFGEAVYDAERRRVWKSPAAPATDDARRAEAAILASYYAMSLATGTVLERPVRVVDFADRGDGRLRRRDWIDAATGAILKSVRHRPDGSVEGSFEVTRFKLGARPGAERFRLPAAAAQLPEKHRQQPDEAAQAAVSRETGLAAVWPRWLPPGFALESVEAVPRGRRRLAHYRFSDGRRALSLFQCPARTRLDFGDHAKRRVTLAAGRGTATWSPQGLVLGWSQAGSRLVLVGPLGLEELRRVADSIP